eukprot:g3090.t1
MQRDRSKSSRRNTSSASSYRESRRKMPLTDAHQLRNAVRQLQLDAEEQLNLEYESQATFEYFHSQNAALQKAFKTLSDVVLEEIDTMRNDFTQRFRVIDAQVLENCKLTQNVQRELTLLKKTFDVWTMKERDWAKDNEILKVSHAHSAEWMQQMQRDMMEVRDLVHNIKQDHVSSTKRHDEISRSLKTRWEEESVALKTKVEENNILLKRQEDQLSEFGRQRLDDLDLIERAVAAVQSQNQRLRTSIEDSLEANHTDCRALSARADALDRLTSTTKIDCQQLVQKLHAQEKESRKRFDNISRIFKV